MINIHLFFFNFGFDFGFGKSVTNAILENPAELIIPIISITLPYGKTLSARMKIFVSLLFSEMAMSLGIKFSKSISVSCKKTFSSLLIVIANGAWSSGNANSAGRWLGEVAADSKCYKEAMALGNQIRAKLKADEDREWNFILKIQSDKVALEKQALKAIRDVGVAWGENQQPTNINWTNMD